MRMTKEQLNALKQKYNVKELWSFSKVHCYEVSPYCYYLKYIKHIKEQDKTGIYSESGSIVHSILEQFYNNEIPYEKMIETYENSLVMFNMANLKYNKSDEEKNAAIANKYEDCIRHFLKNHQKIQGLTKTEEFVVTKIGPYIFQGYADMIGKQDLDWTIYDFKTSTMYTGDKITLESSQLLLYVQSLMQHGVPLEHIKACWDFCKYVKVTYTQKNGTIKERNIERNSIGSSLASSLKTKLKDAGFDKPTIEVMINQVILNNSLDKLPQEVQDQYTFEDCLVYVPLSQELIDSFNQNLLNVLNEIADKTTKTTLCFSDEEAEKIWWDTDEQLKKNEYFHFNLDGFNREQHKPWDDYLKRKEAEMSKIQGIFDNVESDVKNQTTTKQQSSTVDMSWLNDFV